MKPMTEKMQKTVPESKVEIKDDHSSPRRKKIAVIAFCVLAVLLAVAIVIGVIAFIQIKRIKDQWEALDIENMNFDRTEANITFHLPLLNETIEEKVVVTDDEEDITTPKLRTIFDFNRGYAVTRFERDGNGTDVDVCFVTKFTPHGDTSMMRAIVKEEKRDVVVTNETVAEIYISTDEPFDRDLLSERASAMCGNSEMVLMTKSSEVIPDNTEGESAIRKKRARLPRCINEFLCYTETKTVRVRVCVRIVFITFCYYKLEVIEEVKCYRRRYCL